MKRSIALGLFVAAVPVASGAEATPIACDPADAAFICGIEKAEDLVRLGSTPWVVVSQTTVEYGTPPRVLGPGPLRAIHIDTHEVTRLYPDPGSVIDWDRKAYPDCAQPPKMLSSHGLNVRALDRNRFRLYVVNHGTRESIEILDVTVDGGRLHSRWRGCIRAPQKGPPEGVWPNSVVPLPDGRIALSGIHGAIWQVGKGWTPLELNLGPSGIANGVEVSADGRWLFVANTTERSIIRFALDGTAEQTSLKLDFWPDNLRWGEDGHIYTAGPYEPQGYKEGQPPPFAIAQIDPQTFTAREIFRSPIEGVGGGAFSNATSALQVGEHFWVASAHQDRIAILPLKP